MASRWSCQQLYLDLIDDLDNRRITEYRRRLLETKECDEWTNYSKTRRLSIDNMSYSNEIIYQKNRQFVLKSLDYPFRLWYDFRKIFSKQ